MNKLTEILVKCRLTMQISNQEMLKIVKLSLNSDNLEQDTFYMLQRSWKSEKYKKFLLLFRLQNESGIQAINYLDDEYPENLREIYNPPALLFYQGDISLLKTDCTAIVGAREATEYSYRCINGLVPRIIDRYTIVSGLAKGVDGWAHQVTLNNHGKTIAVIGNCLSDYYPTKNKKLQDEIFEFGLVISEYPPGCNIQRWHFPQRNRIIAGISQRVIVTEAKERSGSLITAELAMQENRDVYAIPGKIDESTSKGCNKLIEEGAIPLINFSDF
ncbi:DNA-processing protein DprA [Companilactobacillus allii]|uniref:DNA protecting protein DprA n=1 Tax=Companilactobacillus allii TaxID=1847728 RepID=A0A1P8Q4W6_9LACO|nr:DNA-processing protein DprA [Companilactobacillus allii]APX72903.1 DNA protecting protein DprA [Companilactobacillus allii]USQ67691.1 DNA-processing protein DprA [Companilactobacillus allii]